MPLKAKSPEPTQKRLKLFLYGMASTGKTTASSSFPNAYIIDCEKGTDNYSQIIKDAGSVVLQTTDMMEIIGEVKTLLTEEHPYRTLVIDPITLPYNDLLDKCEAKVGADFGRHYGAANKEMKRLANLVMNLDMNVIITAHAKREYSTNFSVIGQTFDGWRQLDYWFDLVIELAKGKGKNPKRTATVVKTRLETFPDGDSFEWSYDAIKKRYGADLLERQSQKIILASDEQIKEIKALLEVIRLPEGTTDKWFTKANVETWEDMTSEVISKCIQYCKDRLPQANQPKE